MTEKPHELIERLRDDLAAFSEAKIGGKITPASRKRIARGVTEIRRHLDELLREIDPVRQPHAVFDPSEPNVVGRFVALALVAQPRSPLDGFDRFYGSGVYALYYNGALESYAPISRTETPIYVGKADPAAHTAKTPLEQGEKLSGRLKDHLRSINSAQNLEAADFECRALVVQSGWQGAAESYLIRLFKPVWNNETKFLFGIGKHGDDAKTRGNKRSPWDVMHPGRPWASSEIIEDARSIEQINAALSKHFSDTVQYTTLQEIMEEFLNELRQIAS